MRPPVSLLRIFAAALCCAVLASGAATASDYSTMSPRQLYDLAMKDDVNAQHMLATRYANGAGVKADHDTAVYWYKRALLVEAARKAGAEPPPPLTAPSAAAATVAAASATAGESVYLQLGAFTSEARAQGQWRKLVKTHGAKLSRLGSFVASRTQSSGGVAHELLTGSLEADAATSLCGAIKNQGDRCQVRRN